MWVVAVDGDGDVGCVWWFEWLFGWFGCGCVGECEVVVGEPCEECVGVLGVEHDAAGWAYGVVECFSDEGPCVVAVVGGHGVHLCFLRRVMFWCLVIAEWQGLHSPRPLVMSVRAPWSEMGMMWSASVAGCLHGLVWVPQSPVHVQMGSRAITASWKS